MGGIWEPAIIDPDLYTTTDIAADFSPCATARDNITGFLPGFFTPGRRPAFYGNSQRYGSTKPHFGQQFQQQRYGCVALRKSSTLLLPACVLSRSFRPVLISLISNFPYDTTFESAGQGHLSPYIGQAVRTGVLRMANVSPLWRTGFVTGFSLPAHSG